MSHAYAYENLFEQLPKEIREVGLARTNTRRIEPQITGRDQKDFERLFHLGRDLVNGFRAGVFPPRCGCWFRNDCEYRQDCGEWTGNEEEANDAQAGR